MQDRPTARELVEAIREFLEEEILPGLEDQLTGYRTQGAVYALGILERELEREEAFLRAEHERLVYLLGENRDAPVSLEALKDQVIELNQNLAGRIRSGEIPEGTLGHLKQTVAEKLEVASPEYLERYDH